MTVAVGVVGMVGKSGEGLTVMTVGVTSQPQTLLNVEIEVAKAGKPPKGRTELPFAFELTPAEGAQLYETYHGVFINISYSCGML